MANIDALKKSRKTERDSFNKAYNRIQELIALEGADICELEAELNVFKGKVDPYDDVFKEWELLGIIENDPVDSSSHVHEYFLPHRPVVKQHGTTKEAEELPFIEESHHILAEGKFNLRGWKYAGDDDPEQVTSVLGLIWNRKEDELKINNLGWIEIYKLEIISKRVILSFIHRVFDPTGFLCHVLLILKLILQMIWEDNIPWDREVEDNLKLEFLKWFEELISLKKFVC
ncbi:DUF1758 domain-containing protein [Trichonephila inaurata madagascariensis]|uniref:DUF1758 domain-containing protein n=1 Tax=Trichonephila inaurata madagascariensis TaxID=2747483 RepID=A0A8X6Y9B7_9ARAC|nr:DUF1758 domain-containing protein [Trichonephila inaurata madagascariensis]